MKSPNHFTNQMEPRALLVNYYYYFYNSTSLNQDFNKDKIHYGTAETVGFRHIILYPY